MGRYAETECDRSRGDDGSPTDREIADRYADTEEDVRDPRDDGSATDAEIAARYAGTEEDVRDPRVIEADNHMEEADDFEEHVMKVHPECKKQCIQDCKAINCKDECPKGKKGKECRKECNANKQGCKASCKEMCF